MKKDQILFFDTTLRDGEQSLTHSLSPLEKVDIALTLERLGVDYIEAGFPLSSEDDFRSVYEIGRQLNTQTIFSERIDGNLILRRGFNIPSGSNVLIVEDVITTGKSALECLKIIKEHDANLSGFACIIDRSDSTLLIKEKIVSQIKFKINLYNENNLPEKLQKIPSKKPGSRTLPK